MTDPWGQSHPGQGGRVPRLQGPTLRVQLGPFPGTCWEQAWVTWSVAPGAQPRTPLLDSLAVRQNG